MKEDDYNRIARLFLFINNNYSQRHYNYGGFNGSYKTYQIDDVQFPEDTLKLMDKLMATKVVECYDIEYLKSNNYPEKYYNAELIKKSEIEYGFHYQLPQILFYFLFNQLKDAAKQFLKEIVSEEFKSKFGYCIKKDDYLFQYPSSMHEQIFKYLDSRIQYFDILHHQLNFLSDISYDDGRTTLFKTKRIESCISSLDGFNFSEINLSPFAND